MGTILLLAAERVICHALSRHPKETPAAIRCNCPRDLDHGRKDCHGDVGNGKRENSGTGRPFRGTETRTSARPDRLHGAPPTIIITLVWCKEKYHNSGKTRSLLYSITRMTISNLETPVASRSCATRVRCCLKWFTWKLNDYLETKGLLPEEQCRFQPDRSAMDMMFVKRRLQRIKRKTGVSLSICFVDLHRAYDTV